MPRRYAPRTPVAVIRGTHPSPGCRLRRCLRAMPVPCRRRSVRAPRNTALNSVDKKLVQGCVRGNENRDLARSDARTTLRGCRATRRPGSRPRPVVDQPPPFRLADGVRARCGLDDAGHGSKDRGQHAAPARRGQGSGAPELGSSYPSALTSRAPPAPCQRPWWCRWHGSGAHLRRSGGRSHRTRLDVHGRGAERVLGPCCAAPRSASPSPVRSTEITEVPSSALPRSLSTMGRPSAQAPVSASTQVPGSPSQSLSAIAADLFCPDPSEARCRCGRPPSRRVRRDHTSRRQSPRRRVRLRPRRRRPDGPGVPSGSISPSQSSSRALQSSSAPGWMAGEMSSQSPGMETYPGGVPQASSARDSTPYPSPSASKYSSSGLSHPVSS